MSSRKRRRKPVNRPRSPSNRGAKWTLLIVLALLVALVVLLSRLTAEKNSQGEPSRAQSQGQSEARGVKKPAEKKPVSPEFQFYTLLPEEGNQPPPVRSREERADDSLQVPPQAALEMEAETGATYLIQVGSFRAADDAEARKASLALLGLESRVAAATVDGRRYHRVMVGPLSGRQVATVRQQLQQAGIESTPPRRVTN